MAKTYHAQAFSIADIHLEAFKNIFRYTIRILTNFNRSEWDAPSSIIPKKDGQVIFISDFRRLNEQVKRNAYPLLNIKDMLNKLSNFTYAMTLYLIMGYYNNFLTYVYKEVCRITAPFGKYKYNRLPMGVCIAPDIFQEIISTLMDGLEFVIFYLGDLLVITSG